MSEPLVVPDLAQDEDRALPAITYGLYLIGLANGLTILVGLMVAYANRGSAGPRMRSHYVFLIRTVWVALGWWIVGGGLILLGLPLSLVLVGLPMIGLGLLMFTVGHIWFAVRCVVGALYLLRGEAYPRPDSWLF